MGNCGEVKENMAIIEKHIGNTEVKAEQPHNYGRLVISPDSALGSICIWTGIQTIQLTPKQCGQLIRVLEEYMVEMGSPYIDTSKPNPKVQSLINSVGTEICGYSIDEVSNAFSHIMGVMHREGENRYK